MAESSNPRVSVISQKYCAPYPIHLAIVRNHKTLADGNFAVFTDVNVNIIFKVKEIPRFLHEQKLIVDAAGNPIVTVRPKILTLHERCNVFRGESNHSKDLLFTAKIKTFTMEPNLDVFLPNNTAEEVCDFQLKGSFIAESCVVYAGDHERSATTVAQMQKRHKARSTSRGEAEFMVSVNPNIDYAFIVALTVIIDVMGREDHPIPMPPHPVHQVQQPSQRPQRPRRPPYPTQQHPQGPFGPYEDANPVSAADDADDADDADAADDYAVDDDPDDGGGYADDEADYDFDY